LKIKQNSLGRGPNPTL